MEAPTQHRPGTVDIPASPEEVPGPRWYGDELVLDADLLPRDEPGPVAIRVLPRRNGPTATPDVRRSA